MKRSADESLELLAQLAAWPADATEVTTEQVERRWRRCVLTSNDLQRIVTALVDHANEKLYRAYDQSVPCHVTIARRGQLARIKGPTRVAPDAEVEAVEAAKEEFADQLTRILEDIDSPGEVDKISVTIGDNLSLLAVLVFQKRSPGARVIAHGYAEVVPFYGGVAEDFVQRSARLLRGSVSRSLWTIFVPRFLAPRFQLRHEKRASWREVTALRLLVWGLGIAAATVIGLLVTRAIGRLF